MKKDRVLKTMTFEEAKKYLEPSTISRLSKELEDNSIIYYTACEDSINHLLEETESEIDIFDSYMTFFFYRK